MTREELKKYCEKKIYEEHKLILELLEQEPRKDEVILTKKEYGELLSSEFDNGYAKGYEEALEQEPILDKIRAEIEELKPNNPNFKGYFEQNVTLNKVLEVIDKYKPESEDK